MAANSDKPIVLRVDSVAEIFNAPDADPFAAGEGNILGEAALDRLLLRQQVHPIARSGQRPVGGGPTC